MRYSRPSTVYTQLSSYVVIFSEQSLSNCLCHEFAKSSSRALSGSSHIDSSIIQPGGCPSIEGYNDLLESK